MRVTLKKYLKVYKIFGSNVLSSLFASSLDFLLLLIGKLVIFYILMFWVNSMFRHVSDLNGYSRDQVIVFFAVSFLMDKLIQVFFYRGFQLLPGWINEGDFDRLLLLPANSLFLSAFRITDWNDILVMIPILFVLVSKLFTVGGFSLLSMPIFLMFVFLGLSVAFCFFTIVSSLAFRFIKIEAIMRIYRDFMYLAKFPPEVFSLGWTVLLTSVVPIFIIVSLPAKAVLGLLTWPWVCTGFGSLAMLFVVAIKAWKWGLHGYSSVGS
ncbi:hypothetical protein A3K34_01090 [candidate division WWE3 bacterium RIFOXYC1_FULL_40_10]|uniref:ABC transporter permease n=1 Tax=candidate division WWE3 bacterium RIFOXYA2_FULL_46_9 TaxID=1802636 RepID=A0A1F4W286_UNCKA|nr:MAG: hypothetical protein A3K58_01090 [candidate division WWE3 bacterium RIFOXYB1_FULL_40_22]OGC61464.1 MAG: hypothetical protein A3K37_01090 [candidate division WWE3 bacterium RIFOXYA1_FULL_40_11]OGC63398.1 MAG: hypothetical protein A2264_01565 [candidate division WWE3 bacterium RIFOXYA2_FULL_46_9]OGC64572.1 MAG: hypothetical protein A2326_03670 [candidate division WWE3 bacterium RIFOXYB2_FULL_41_6]OGC65847.1 MAG: hypothetical protein A3K34_01090 [candidate division WWE3 bacterium RIFOXYC1_